MKYMLATFAIILNIIMGIQVYSLFNNNIDTEFEPYVSEFEWFYGKKVKSGISFADLDDDSVGMCYYVTGNIEIDRDYWETQDEFGKEELIFHELGHCVLNKGHNEHKMGECPASIMYPNLVPGCYKQHREYYLAELFDKLYPPHYNSE